MESLFGRRQFSMQAMTDFSHLEKRVQDHLKNVYTCLFIAMFAAAGGSFLHLYLRFMLPSLITVIGSIGLMLWLAATPHTKQNFTKRMAILGGFATLTGMSLGPLMDYVIRLDPSIIPTAFMGTCVIFGSFSLAALFCRSRTFLYLGGALMSGMMWLFFLSLLNIFLGSQLIFDVTLYLGLLIFCGFVLFDTQLIVEKCRNGDDDFIWHSVDLFLDFINLFRKLLIILSSKEEKKRSNRN
ncbi:probable Bax inhibitor 1 [Liolophura sinensis]|uniref:probable Bax inhibitor 1 n=1 Tax=Liolophura sinensis TaxID=3198878 RepID=UPI003159359C